MLLITAMPSPNTAARRPSHTGGCVAGLGYVNNADQVIYQDVVIPANALQASLQFWYRITTNETTTTLAHDFGTT